MRILSLFSGIGAFEKALKNLKIDFELVGYCEIDKYASKAYSMVHRVSEDKNLGDVIEVNANQLPTDIDMITYGFPCQDISVAGKQKGFVDQNGKTRSGLFFDGLRIIETTKPKIAIAENVKNLTSKKFKVEFDIVLNCLEQAGYNNYYKVLNAKDFGVPQNRERVFIISIRKDIDNGCFIFPQSKSLELRLKDLLEDEVDEKYYLTDIKTPKLMKTIEENNEPKIKQVLQMYPNSGNPQAGRIYDQNGISPAMDTCSGGNRMPKIITDKGIRKLTPRECWRLMGFDDEDFNTLSGISNTQLYKQAGNSIVVNVLEAIFSELFKLKIDN